MQSSALRQIARVLPAVRTVEGEGFVVRRPFPAVGVDQLDPFLLLDQMGPVEHGPGEAVGTSDHPHRGFETVTYLLEGELEHRDSLGNRGVIGPGDTQWMTAGRGVIHREGPSERLRAEGGRLHGVQLWVNLPAVAKMRPAAYQDIRAGDLAVSSPAPGAKVRVIAGALFDLVGPGSTHTPIAYAHLTLEPGSRVATAVHPAHTVLVHPLVGSVKVGDTDLREAELGLLGAGDRVELEGSDVADSEVLVLTGLPLGEPIARYGPFVMNTRQELIDAIEDYNGGRFL